MATPTLRSWYGIAFSTSTTQTSIGMGAPTGTDYPQVGDYIVAFYGSDNLSATTPTGTFSVTGAGAVGAWSYVPAVSAANGTAAGATIGTFGWAQVTTAFTSASRVNVAFASGAAIKSIVASAVNGADVTSVASLGGSNVSPASLGAANATDLNVVGTVTESNAAPGVTAGTQIAAVGSTGGGGAANEWSSLVYNSGAAVTTTFTDGMALGVKFVGTSAPAFSGSLALSGSGSATFAASAPAVNASQPISGSGTLALSASSMTTSDSQALTGSESLALDGSAALSGALALSGSGTLDLSGSVPASSTYRMYEAATGPSASASDFQGITTGVEFYVTADCNLTEIRWWQPASAAQVDARTARVWQRADGVVLDTTPTVAPSGSGWQTLTFATPVPLTANVRYMAGVYHPGGGYAATGAYYTAPGADEVNGPLVIPNGGNATGAVQGGYMYGGGLALPTNTYNSTLYWVDVTVATAGAAPESHSGSLASSGSGALALSGSPAPSGALAPSGSGSLALGGSPAPSGALATSGSGTLALSGSASQPGSGTLGQSGIGSLALGGSAAVAGTSALSGSGTLAFSGSASMPGALALGGSGSPALSGGVTTSGALALGGSGSLALLCVAVDTSGGLDLAAVGTLALAGGSDLRNFEARVVLAERRSRVSLGEHLIPSVGPRRRTVTLKEQTS